MLDIIVLISCVLFLIMSVLFGIVTALISMGSIALFIIITRMERRLFN